MALKFPARVKAQTSTTGTGPFTVTEPGQAGYRTFTRAVSDGDMADGDSIPILIVDTTVTDGPNLFQFATASWNNTTKVLTIVTNHQPATPPSWGVGTRDVLVVSDPLLFALLTNNLSDLSSIASAVDNLGLNDKPQSISDLQTGGTIGKFVRKTTVADTWADASQADTNDQLAVVAFKLDANTYVYGGRVAKSGVSPGVVYYLSTGGDITSTPPTPDTNVRRRPVAIGINTGELLVCQFLTIEK